MLKDKTNFSMIIWILAMSDYFETYSVRCFVSMRAFMKWFVSRPRNVYVDRSASLMYYVN